MVRLAVHGAMSFSDAPLRLALWAGLAISGLTALLGLYALFSWLFVSSVVHGWTSMVLIVSFLSGINLFMTGIVGLYVGGIYAEVKRRPLYVIDRLTGFEGAIAAARNAKAPEDGGCATYERRVG